MYQTLCPYCKSTYFICGVFQEDEHLYPATRCCKCHKILEPRFDRNFFQHIYNPKYEPNPWHLKFIYAQEPHQLVGIYYNQDMTYFEIKRFRWA